MALGVWLLPFGAQALLMALDEGWFHRRRGLSRREWIGHALDSLGFLACLLLPLFLAPTPGHLALFAGLGLGSCLLVTKDEFLHQRLCTGGEHACHAGLFLLHPLVLLASGYLWLCARNPAGAQAIAAVLGLQAPTPSCAAWGLRGQALAVAGCLTFQVAWWGRR
jgi:hypothetical protein